MTRDLRISFYFQIRMVIGPVEDEFCYYTRVTKWVGSNKSTRQSVLKGMDKAVKTGNSARSGSTHHELIT